MKRSKEMRKGIFIFLLFCYSRILCFASFEGLEFGGRATALAGAFVAQTKDISAIFYNPASITGLKRFEILTSYKKLYCGLSDNSSIGEQMFIFGGRVEMKGKYFGNMGVGCHILSLDELYKESIIKLSYGYPVKKNCYAGLSVSQFKVSYGNTNYTEINPVFDSGYVKSAIGVDIGMVYTTDILNFGISILGFNEPDVGLKYENKISRSINAGITFKQRIFDLSAAGVLSDGGLKFKTGIETWILGKRLAFRSGVNIGSADYRNIALGAGYRDTWYEIDYSFEYPLSGISDTLGHHQLSMVFRFGKQEQEDEGLTWRDFLEFVKAKKGEIAKEEKPEKLKEEVTLEQIAQAQELIVNAKKEFEIGLYAQALEKVEKAGGILKDDEEIKNLLRKGKALVKITPELKEKGKKEFLLKKGIGAYIRGNGKLSLECLIYASQLWPKDSRIGRILAAVKAEFFELAEKEKLVPGINLVNQKLQQALEFIYDGKYVSAVSICKEVLELEPKSVLAMMRMGSAYWAMDQTKTARKIWREALKLDPNNEQLIEFLKMRKKVKKEAGREERRIEKKKVDEKTMSLYRSSLSYYERVKRSGANKESLKIILHRIIEKYKDTGIDMSKLYKELEKMK